MNTCTLMLAVVLLIPASQAKQQALAFRVEKYLPEMQQSINDASVAGEMSTKIQLPNVPWKDLRDITKYLEAGGYGITPYGDKESQALIVKW